MLGGVELYTWTRKDVFLIIRKIGEIAWWPSSFWGYTQPNYKCYVFAHKTFRVYFPKVSVLIVLIQCFVLSSYYNAKLILRKKFVNALNSQVGLLRKKSLIVILIRTFGWFSFQNTSFAFRTFVKVVVNRRFIRELHRMVFALTLLFSRG